MTDPLARVPDEERRRAYAHALWRAGDLSYLLHAGQEAARAQIYASEARRHVLCTGRRWGKSRLMCVLAAEACIRKDRARVVYAAPTQGMVEEFILPHMLILADEAPEDCRPDFNGGVWRFPNGSRIVIKGCEDRRKADRLRGPEADLAIADEGGFIPHLDYVVGSVLAPQLWETRGVMLLPSTPPESPDHPFVGLLEAARSEGAYYHATSHDAPHLTPEMIAEAIEDAGGADSLEWQREGLARIVRDETRVVLPEFPDHGTPEHAIIVAAHPRPQHYLPHVVGDLGFVDMTVLAFGYYDFVADLDVIEDELVFTGARSDQIAAAVDAKERELWPGVRVHRRRVDAPPITRADLAATGRADDHDVGAWGAPAKDDVVAAANAARVRLRRAKMRVHPRCETLIQHATYARWDASRRSFERPSGGGHHYDGCAALIYFVRSMDRTSNPYPAIPVGTTIEDHHIPRIPSAAEKTAKALFGRRR